jgi:hypothetical protein
MKKTRFPAYLLVGSLILILALTGCRRRATDPAPEVFIPLDPPVVEVDPLFGFEPVETLVPLIPPTPPPLVIVIEPTPTPQVIIVQPTPPPLVIVVDPPTPTPLVVVVTATPQRVVILPETGADLTAATAPSSRILPVSLILAGISLAVLGLLSRRR